VQPGNLRHGFAVENPAAVGQAPQADAVPGAVGKDVDGFLDLVGDEPGAHVEGTKDSLELRGKDPRGYLLLGRQAVEVQASDGIIDEVGGTSGKGDACQESA